MESEEEEKVNKLVDEQLRQEMEKRGMLNNDISQPSGSVGSVEDALARYVVGEITAWEAIRRGVNFGLGK